MDKTVEVSQAARELVAAECSNDWARPSILDPASVATWNMPVREALRAVEAALQSTTRATQPEAALREALEGGAQVYFPPELDKELARIEWPRSRSLLHEAALFCGRVQVLNGDARLTAQAVDLGDRLRAALEDHRHG